MKIQIRTYKLTKAINTSSATTSIALSVSTEQEGPKQIQRKAKTNPMIATNKQ